MRIFIRMSSYSRLSFIVAFFSFIYYSDLSPRDLSSRRTKLQLRLSSSQNRGSLGSDAISVSVTERKRRNLNSRPGCSLSLNWGGLAEEYRDPRNGTRNLMTGNPLYGFTRILTPRTRGVSWRDAV